MPRIRDILPAVLAVRSDTIDQALSLALKHAEPDEIGELALGMLERGKANGVESLIESFDKLPAEARHRLIVQAEQFATSIRRAASRRGPVAANNALTIIESAASTRLAYLVTALCRNQDPAVRERAAETLVSLAKRSATSHHPHAQPHQGAKSTRYLTEAIDQAVAVFSRSDHPAMLTAMLWLMPRPIPAAQAALAKPEHPAAAALDQQLRQDPSQASRRSLLLLVGIEPLADAARQALSDAAAAHQLAEPLELGHMLSLPPTRHALARASRLSQSLTDSDTLASLTGSSLRWLPSYLDAIGKSPASNAEQLAKLIALPDDATRLAVLRRLLSIARDRSPDNRTAADRADDALAELTDDPLAAIARTALWHLLRVEYAGLSRILADLVHSRHPTIRQVASQRLAPLGFNRYWQAWPKLTGPRRLAAGRALIKIDPTFHRQLAGRLASSDPATRQRALVIIADLNQGSFFEDALLELCATDDMRILATTVRALRGCSSKSAIKTLDLATKHPDARVRANAVEAMDHQQAAANIQRLLELSSDHAQRPRANAIKALLELRVNEAMPSLIHMLEDHRAEHRVSALWLIDELGILHLAKQVAEMSLTDEDPDVKRRATSVIQHLIDELNQPPPPSDASAPQAAEITPTSPGGADPDEPIPAVSSAAVPTEPAR